MRGLTAVYPPSQLPTPPHKNIIIQPTQPFMTFIHAAIRGRASRINLSINGRFLFLKHHLGFFCPTPQKGSIQSFSQILPLVMTRAILSNHLFFRF